MKQKGGVGSLNRPPFFLGLVILGFACFDDLFELLGCERVFSRVWESLESNNFIRRYNHHVRDSFDAKSFAHFFLWITGDDVVCFVVFEEWVES